MKVNVFGLIYIVEKNNDRWDLYRSSGDGKRIKVVDFVIPSDLKENEIPEYLFDILHEFATPENNEIKIIKN